LNRGRRQVVRIGYHVPTHKRNIGEVVSSWERHAGTPALEWARGNGFRILSVTAPSYADGILARRDVVEELFAKIVDPSGAVNRREVCAVELAGEVLRDGAAEWSTRVDANL